MNGKRARTLDAQSSPDSSIAAAGRSARALKPKSSITTVAEWRDAFDSKAVRVCKV
jgi:hypothetical protein